MDVKELRAKAKAAGIRNWHNKKPENLIIELEGKPRKLQEVDDTPDSYKKKKQAIPKKGEAIVNISDSGKTFLSSIGFDFQWIPPLINQFGLDRMNYIDKFMAFKCYKDGEHIDWIDVNKLSIRNGGRNLCQILNKHQPTSIRKEFPNRGIVTAGGKL